MSNQNQDTTYLDVQKIVQYFFSNVTTLLRNFVLFIKKKWLILLALLITGGILGYLKDKNTKKYINTIIVIPNFKSVDYLYQKIDLLHSKVKAKDTTFSNQYKLPKKGISKVTVEPIVDIYTLAERNSSHYNVFKTLSENSNANKVVKEHATSKNFPKHLITITSSVKLNSQSIDGIVDFLNESKFYERMRKQTLKNIERELSVNNQVISQIDAILNEVPKNTNVKSTLYFNENSKLNDLVRQKLILVEKNSEFRVHYDDYKYIINPIDKFLNIEYKKGLTNKYKFILPFFLVFCFILISFFKRIL